VVVLGPERAKLLATRYESIRAKTMELLDKQHTNGDNNGNSD
jgi:hypothetical protein